MAEKPGRQFLSGERRNLATLANRGSLAGDLHGENDNPTLEKRQGDAMNERLDYTA